MLFRMVPKHHFARFGGDVGFRAVLFRMVPKPDDPSDILVDGFRAVLFRMVPTHIKSYSFFK